MELALDDIWTNEQTRFYCATEIQRIARGFLVRRCSIVASIVAYLAVRRGIRVDFKRLWGAHRERFIADPRAFLGSEGPWRAKRAKRAK